MASEHKLPDSSSSSSSSLNQYYDTIERKALDDILRSGVVRYRTSSTYSKTLQVVHRNVFEQIRRDMDEVVDAYASDMRFLRRAEIVQALGPDQPIPDECVESKYVTYNAGTSQERGEWVNSTRDEILAAMKSKLAIVVRRLPKRKQDCFHIIKRARSVCSVWVNVMAYPTESRLIESTFQDTISIAALVCKDLSSSSASSTLRMTVPDEKRPFRLQVERFTLSLIDNDVESDDTGKRFMSGRVTGSLYKEITERPHAFDSVTGLAVFLQPTIIPLSHYTRKPLL